MIQLDDPYKRLCRLQTQGKDSEKLFSNSFSHALFDLLSIYCTPDIVRVAEVTVTRQDIFWNLVLETKTNNKEKIII